jgi:hypothetical protein
MGTATTSGPPPLSDPASLDVFTAHLGNDGGVGSARPDRAASLKLPKPLPVARSDGEAEWVS